MVDGVTPRVLQAFCLLAVASPLSPVSAEPEIVVPAQLAASAGVTLDARTEVQVIDGAQTKFIAFHNGNSVLRYTPPLDWEMIGEGKVVFRKGRVMATVSVFPVSTPEMPPTPEVLAQFGKETLARVIDGGSPAVTTSMLPITTGDLVLGESTVVFQRAGEAQTLQCVRSWGNGWQLRIEITGPKTEFDRVASRFLSGVCNLEIRTTDEVHAEASKRERAALVPQVLARDVTAAQALPGAPRRGQLP